MQPDHSWLRSFAAASLPILPSCSGQALAVLAGAMGRLWQRGEQGGREEGSEREEDAEKVAEPPLGSRREGAQGGWGEARGDEAQAGATTADNLSSQPSARGSEAGGDSTVEEACPMTPWVGAVLGEAQRRFSGNTSHHLSSSSSSSSRGVGGGQGSSSGSSRSWGSLGPEDLVSLALALPALCSISCDSRRGNSGGDGDGGGGSEAGVGGEGSGWVGPHKEGSNGNGASTSPGRLDDGGSSAEAIVPPSGWVEGLQEAMRYQLPAFSATQLANGLMALARLHRRQRGLESRMREQASSSPEAGSVASVFTAAASRDNARPSNEQRGREARTSPSEAGVMLLPPLDRAWLQDWLRAADRLAPTFNAADAAQALWALAALGATCAPPPPRLLAASQKQKKKQTGALPPLSFAVHLQGQGPLAAEGVLGAASDAAAPVLRVPPEWAEHMLASTRPRLAEMSSPQLSMVAWALSALRVRPGWQWSLALFTASAATMRTSTVMQQWPGEKRPSAFSSALAAPMLQPLAVLDGDSAAEVGVRRSGSKGEVMPRDLAVLLLGLGHLRLRPLEVRQGLQLQYV